MIRLLTNLKKSFWQVVIIVILLCVQAATDLALPDFTSKIVNTGIQAGGIETAVPSIISKEDMDLILMFSDKDNEILDRYKLLGNTLTNNEQKILEKYFGKNKVEEIQDVKKDAIYTLNNINEEEAQELETILTNPLMELSVIKSEETAKQIKEQISSNLNDMQKQYLQDKTLTEIIQTMPEVQREKMLEQFTSKIDEMQASIKTQAAVTYVKQIYSELGIDTDKIQNDYIFITGIQMLGVALISMISAVLIMLFSSRVA